MKFNKKLIISLALVMIPIFIIAAVIIGRKIITPTNEEIIDQLKNAKMYTCNVEYNFINSKDSLKEETKQYYRYDKGARIEFDDYYKRVKVYNGNEIKVNENNEQYSIDKNLDQIYPLAFMENILSYDIEMPIQELDEEWGDDEYLQINIKYNQKNRYLSNAKFYIDKNKKIPVLLKILDDNGKERIVIKYSNFKYEKIINAGLF